MNNHDFCRTLLQSVRDEATFISGLIDKAEESTSSRFLGKGGAR